MAEVHEIHEPFLGLPPEDEKFAKTLVAKAVFSTVTQPLVVSRTLIQLGFEPFPLSTGKTLIWAGRDAYFLPNAFSYMRQLAQKEGLKILWTGIDSGIAALLVSGIVSHQTEKYIDEYYPNIGGPKEDTEKEEQDLTDHQSFKRVLRRAMRDSVVRTAAIIAARPFTVVMVRQIAQVIGKEAKYTGAFSGLRLVGLEEGPGGLFGGLVPQIVGELLVIWGVHSLTFTATRLLLRSDIGNTKQTDEKAVKAAKDVHSFVHTAVPFIINSFGYPYGVVSTIMAVAGSGLAVSFLPYSPAFLSWHNAWDYLNPHGLKRGNRLFLREQAGAVSVGADQQLYASNKFFA
ncbi:unnamed protein product [Caenorhabditis auriculariae]|uniref:Uncharacterized protein n=1 Tax=Caenorhabditis auriculariae TaxID=2777116 RepID=A0A8S1H8J5_9PELO|nr:unnamed protein product [Caenorhabditis auriculariae]